MKLPWTLMRRAKADDLRAAAATGEVDQEEATRLEAERDEIREDRNALLQERADLQNRNKDLQDALGLAEAEYERLQDAADNIADAADRLRRQLTERGEQIKQLQAQLTAARHGEREVYVLQSKGAPITAARSRQGAIRSAVIFGVPSDSWEPSDDTRTDGWAITQIQLIAEEPQDLPSQTRS